MSDEQQLQQLQQESTTDNAPIVEQGETKEELIQRHKKEQKDLIATITGLKKQATKKTRKGVLQKCQDLQDNLNQKHKQELNTLVNGNDKVEEYDEDEEEITPEKLLEQLSLENKSQPEQSSTPNNNNNNNNIPPTTLNKPKKRNRQKERLERRQQEIEKIKLEAKLESENMVNHRELEQQAMKKLLTSNNLQIFEIKPDGHCLFSSIQDQLSIRHNDNTIDVQSLRNLAGDYILENQDEFLPFLFNEPSIEFKSDGNIDIDIEKYVHQLKSTAMWGSDLEILAIAKIFNCPIMVFMAQSSTPLIINEEGEKPGLKLGYFKHSYGLGEHYNSLRDI